MLVLESRKYLTRLKSSLASSNFVYDMLLLSQRVGYFLLVIKYQLVQIQNVL